MSKLQDFDINDVSFEKVVEIFGQEKNILDEVYHWNTDYSFALKKQLARHRRLTGSIALIDDEPVGHMFWFKEDDTLTLTGYFFRQLDDPSFEMIFLKRMCKRIKNEFHNFIVEGQLLFVNTPEKKQVFESFGFSTFKREYMCLPLDQYKQNLGEEEAWLFSRFPQSAAQISSFIQELSFSMYRSYQGTIDEKVSPNFGSLSGCKTFISNLFDYPVYGEILLNASYVSRDMSKSLTGMILVSRSNNEAGHIVQISVVPWFQSLGIGKMLMQMSLNEMTKSNFKYAILMVTSENKNAVRLYKNLGFRTISEFFSLHHKPEIESDI